MTNPSPAARNERLVKALQAAPAIASADEDLIRRGRYVTLDILVIIGERRCYLPILSGRVHEVEISLQRMRPSAFTVSAAPDAWEKFWQPMPEPGWHDLFAMNKRGEATIEGDMKVFMQNLQYFKDVFAIPRRTLQTI